MQAGDITYTVRAMGHLIDLLDVQLRNLTPGGKDSAARSLNKVLRYTTLISVNKCQAKCISIVLFTILLHKLFCFRTALEKIMMLVFVMS